MKGNGPQVVREEKRIASAERTAVTPNYGAPSHISGKRISSLWSPKQTEERRQVVWPGLQTPLSRVDPKMSSGLPELSHTRPRSSFNWEGQAVPVRSPQRPPLLWTQVDVE